MKFTLLRPRRPTSSFGFTPSLRQRVATESVIDRFHLALQKKRLWMPMALAVERRDGRDSTPSFAFDDSSPLSTVATQADNNRLSSAGSRSNSSHRGRRSEGHVATIREGRNGTNGGNEPDGSIGPTFESIRYRGAPYDFRTRAARELHLPAVLPADCVARRKALQVHALLHEASVRRLHSYIDGERGIRVRFAGRPLQNVMRTHLH